MISKLKNNVQGNKTNANLFSGVISRFEKKGFYFNFMEMQKEIKEDVVPKICIII